MGFFGPRHSPLSRALKPAGVLVAALAVLLIVVEQPSEGTVLTQRQPLARQVTAARWAETFYVTPAGNNSNSGTSPTEAWRTVARVDQASLEPGDQVLFQGGATFGDAVLNPPTSGTADSPIVFGAYGQGEPVITRGAWFVQNHLVFDRLHFGGTFYGGSVDYGTSNDVTLLNSTVSLPSGNSDLGVFANGQGWVISGNRIENTGQSGLLLWGSGYEISQNTITNTGLDTSIPYNAHGIYLDASNATITGNTITNFQNSGISVRYRNSRIRGNLISGGQIGIDFFQTDPQPGTGNWSQNVITKTSVAGIYVSPQGVFRTRESFVITDNTIDPRSGVFTNIAPTRGDLRIVRDNSR